MGEVIAGRYELLDPIASGSAGSVWRAGDHRSGRLCAAKIMRQRDSTDLLRFVREKSIRLDHPHLLTPTGFVADDEHVAIGMPLASGGTLARLVRDHGPLSDELAALLLSQLLAGLDRLHQEGWVHRDVKPGNILLEAVGRGEPCARLADFGIAVHEDDVRLTATGFVNGTPGYVAPEILATGRISRHQDLWAAGVVAISMIAPGTEVDRAGAGSPAVQAALQGVAPPLREAVLSLLQVVPEQRCPAPGASIASLQGLARSRPAPPYRDRTGREILFPALLPPLPEGSPWADGHPPGPPRPMGPLAAAAAGTSPALASPALSSPTLAAAASPALSSPPLAAAAAPAPGGARRRRRGSAVLLALAALALAGAATLGTVAVRGSLLPPGPDELARRDVSIGVGDPCAWSLAGTEAVTATGAPVTCTDQGEGRYRWERTGR